jgi:hypothetical protein
MKNVMDYPALVFVISFLVLCLSGQVGAFIGKRRGSLEGVAREDFDVIRTAILTLLGLIIGFSFAMAASRYDLRKSYEEAEANAIGTEYIRADLLPAADAAKVRALLARYLDQRVLFYKTQDAQHLSQINAYTAQLQAELWSVVRASAQAEPTSVIALVVSGMNDVLNSAGYTQAAWWNRIPIEAWGLLFSIAIFCNVLMGYSSRDLKTRAVIHPVLPLIVSISFMLIADVDTPRTGLIRVMPQNLLSLVDSLRPHQAVSPISTI